MSLWMSQFQRNLGIFCWEFRMEVHLIMLGAEIVLLEGIRLADVPVGAYLLHAAPLNLRGCDGSPCRATLIEL